MERRSSNEYRQNKLEKKFVSWMFNLNSQDIPGLPKDFEFHIDHKMGDGFIFYEVSVNKKKGWSLTFKKSPLVLFSRKCHLIYIIEPVHYRELGEDPELPIQTAVNHEGKTIRYKLIPSIRVTKKSFSFGGKKGFIEIQ